MKKNKIIVKTNSGNYPIIIGRNLISNLSKIFGFVGLLRKKV